MTPTGLVSRLFRSGVAARPTSLRVVGRTGAAEPAFTVHQSAVT